jgi:hypothetical protein
VRFDLQRQPGHLQHVRWRWYLHPGQSGKLSGRIRLRRRDCVQDILLERRRLRARIDVQLWRLHQHVQLWHAVRALSVRRRAVLEVVHERGGMRRRRGLHAQRSVRDAVRWRR